MRWQNHSRIVANWLGVTDAKRISLQLDTGKVAITRNPPYGFVAAGFEVALGQISADTG